VKIKLNISALGRTQAHEYVVRFVFGGAVTLLAGVIAKRYGPEVGGLFLAFPAIFPAAATLIKNHEERKKQRVGETGIMRGRMAAGADATGTAMGCLGLIVFAAIVWQSIPTHSPVLVLCVATIAWFVTAFLVWKARDTLGRRFRQLLRERRAHGHLPMPR
jgi:Protein of unknown function (DUF3147)